MRSLHGAARHRLIAAVAAALAALVVALPLGGCQVLSAGQGPTTLARPSTVPTAAPRSTVPSPRFTTFQLPASVNPVPAEAAVGPDGAVWYTDQGSAPRIVRISPNGAARVFPLPGLTSDAAAFITAGPDGALWFTRPAHSHIARMTVSGEYSEYALTAQSQPEGIVAGPDGAIRFTEEVANKIGRITTSGQISEFALPSRPPAQCGQLCPYDIAVGPDGALWFVDIQLGSAGGIGRITSAGTVSLYSAPGATRIVAGPDGDLWFADERSAGQIGRITPAGQITHFTVPGLQQPPVVVRSLAVGADRAIWFTIAEGLGAPNPAATVRPGQLGRIAPDGSSTLYAPPGEGTTGPIVRAPDGSLWAFATTTVTRVTLS